MKRSRHYLWEAGWLLHILERRRISSFFSLSLGHLRSVSGHSRWSWLSLSSTRPSMSDHGFLEVAHRLATIRTFMRITSRSLSLGVRQNTPRGVSFAIFSVFTVSAQGSPRLRSPSSRLRRRKRAPRKFADENARRASTVCRRRWCTPRTSLVTRRR